MIKIFLANEKNFASNGEKVLHPVKAVIAKEDNGDYLLHLEIPMQEKDYIVTGNVVVADTPWGEQGFRVYNPKKKDTRITCDCRHLFYDSENYNIIEGLALNMTCQQALDVVNSSTDALSPFTVRSDIEDLHSYASKRESLYSAFKNVVDLWGGHLVRDNYSIAIKKHIGEDNGITLRYGKNISTMTASEDWSKVATKILPIGKGGLLLEPPYISTDDLPEGNPHKGYKYDIPYTKTVTFDQDIDKDDYNSEDAFNLALREDLRRQALEYLDKNCVPRISYSVKAQIGVTDIGDIIEVYHEKLGINLLTNVISVKYDCLQETLIEVNFGNFTNKLKNLITNVTGNTETQIRNEVSSNILPEVDDKVANLLSVVGNRVAVGSLTLCNYHKVDGERVDTVACSYNYLMIDGLFTGISIPNGYTKGYKISAQFRTQGTGSGVEVRLNNISTYPSLTSYPTNSIYRGSLSSRVFRQDEILLEDIQGLTERKGLNLYVANSTSLSSEVWNVTIEAYLIRR